MACFIVPATEAIMTTIAAKHLKSQEAQHEHDSGRILSSEKLDWLNKMLWGGSGLLAFEHVWHGEVTPFFPFLTAASNAADTAEMLREMATSGIGMAVLVTVVWAGMAAVTHHMEKTAHQSQIISTEGVQQ